MDWLQLGVAGGALVTLITLARLFFHQTKDLTAHQERQQDQVLSFFGNHMSENIKTQVKVAEAIDDMSVAIRAIAESVQKQSFEENRRWSIYKALTRERDLVDDTDHSND